MSALPEDPVQAALDAALGLLAWRPRTGRELQRELEARGHPADAVAVTCRRLQRSGRLDDEALALHYMLTRSERLGHGPRRLIRELQERGISTDLAQSVWDRAVDSGDVDPEALLRREVSRRVGETTVAAREWRRIYNALLRAGFGSGEIRAALEPHRGSQVGEAAHPDGFDDDIV